MKYSEADTINIINKRRNFPSLSALSHIHCCFSTMVYENIDDKDQYDRYDIFDISNLVIDFDKLAHNLSSNTASTEKSLDFGFVISDENNKYIVLGDLKLNKKSINNPYKDLLKKLENTNGYVNQLDLSRFQKVFIIYPNHLLEDVISLAKNIRNRRSQENDQMPQLGQFEFVSLAYIKEQFFD
ncbi:hypothetical protein NYR79_00915 [Actinobacillus equuli subsp. haemolyticus]|uniref:hypothetical protein n=1 Tax=Actinobacillus equuli TaxID=718 RepID=UPI002440EECC|nr:hypothetical protein [Actinobacillus equuli]WGE71470.1 hypothetical protein NYR79_00915 [Actinobacillus equuli subsp. haemolyticus]